jgi:hypothetical protein
MSAARDLLRQARFRQAQTDERISHPLCNYNALGAPTCRVCPGVKLDAKSWPIHIESASHKRNAANWNEANRVADATTPAPRSPTVPADNDSAESIAVVNNTTTNNDNDVAVKSIVADKSVASVVAAAQLPAGFFDADIVAEQQEHDEQAARLDAEFAEFTEAVGARLAEETPDADLAADAAVAVASDLEQSQAKIQQLEALKSRFKRARQDGGAGGANKKPNKATPADEESEELSDLDDDAWRRRATKK